MIILSSPITLYGKKVIADIGTRLGYATPNNFSCGVGQYDEVKNFWPNFEEATEAYLDQLLSTQSDFDADKFQPDQEEFNETQFEEEHEIGREYSPYKDTLDFNRYFRRLEDIDVGYISKYIGYMVFNIKNHDDGVRAFNAKHRDQPVLRSRGDDEDEFTELADLQVMPDDNDWPLHVKQTAEQNLPYVIKRLHNMSCYVGVHMLSFIVAYLKAYEKNIRQKMSRLTTKTLTHNDVISEGVYKCDDKGNILKQILVQNKNKKAFAMFEWIIGASKDYAAYYQDYLDFVHYCEVLNIDLFRDDMTKYQADFVNNLIVTTVTPNKQYDKQVYNAILNNQTNMPQTSLDDVNPIENTLNTFLQVCETNPTIGHIIMLHDSVRSANNLKLAVSLFNTFKLYLEGEVTSAEDYAWIDGYLHYKEELVTMPSKFFSDPNGNVVDDYCIVSELGYLIQLTQFPSLYLMTLAAANNNLLNKVSYKDSTYKYEEWSRMGT